MGGDVGTVDERHTAYSGRDFVQQLQPFSADRGLEVMEARDIAAGMGQVRDKATTNRIGYGNKYDWDRFVAFCTIAAAGLAQTTMISGARAISSALPARMRSASWPVKR